MEIWIVRSLKAMRVADILEMGPSQVTVSSNEQEVVCAQIQVFEDGVYWLRLSEVILGTPLINDFTSSGLELDTWNYDGLFDDTTHGYLFSKKRKLIAKACIAWFSERHGFESPGELGCEYFPADRIPRA